VIGSLFWKSTIALRDKFVEATSGTIYLNLEATGGVRDRRLFSIAVTNAHLVVGATEITQR
jgi:hypothetical protein